MKQVFTGAILPLAVGEWNDHIFKFLNDPEPNYGYRFADEKVKMMALITQSLRQAYADYDPELKRERKDALQYALNRDEHIAPRTRENGSITDDLFAIAQHLVFRPDGYTLCEWMLEALFPNEDWHTDVSHWIPIGMD